MSAQASIANVQGRARYLALPISAAAGKGQDPHAQLRPCQHPSPQPPTCTGAHRQAGPAPHCPAGTQTGARWSSGTCRHTCPEYTTLSSTSIAAPVGSLSLSLSLSLTHTHTRARARVRAVMAFAVSQLVPAAYSPDTHPGVCQHRTHGVVPSIVPLLLAELEDLLQLLPKHAVCLC